MATAPFSSAFFEVLCGDFAITVIQLYFPPYTKFTFGHLPLVHPLAMKSYNQNPSFWNFLQYVEILYQ
jgi:hypothetical protein